LHFCNIRQEVRDHPKGSGIDVIDRDQLLQFGRAVKSANPGVLPMRFVGCGRPLAGHEVRVVDRLDQELPERYEGYIHFRGPSCTSGYMNRPEENNKLFHGAWLDSGDLGYLAEGDLFITGRVKDLIKHDLCGTQ
jgi:acyl-CoA synthetase (AMP-forming)/AMP-acid ligase II